MNRTESLNRAQATLVVVSALLAGFVGGRGLVTVAVAGVTPQEAEVAALREAEVNPITPEAVAETFAFGTKSTDLQRDVLEQTLVGSVVEWELVVYDIAYADGMYELTSKRIPIQSQEALPLVHVFARIQAQGAEDEALLRSVKTDDQIRIRGVVQDVLFRTRVVIEPAVVVGDGT